MDDGEDADDDEGVDDDEEDVVDHQPPTRSLQRIAARPAPTAGNPQTISSAMASSPRTSGASTAPAIPGLDMNESEEDVLCDDMSRTKI